MFVKDQPFIGKIIAGLPVCASNSQVQHNYLPRLPVPCPSGYLCLRIIQGVHNNADTQIPSLQCLIAYLGLYRGVLLSARISGASAGDIVRITL